MPDMTQHFHYKQKVKVWAARVTTGKMHACSRWVNCGRADAEVLRNPLLNGQDG